MLAVARLFLPVRVKHGLSLVSAWLTRNKKPYISSYVGGGVLEVLLLLLLLLLPLLFYNYYYFDLQLSWEGRYDPPPHLRMCKLRLRSFYNVPKVTQLGSNITEPLGSKVASHFPLSTF